MKRVLLALAFAAALVVLGGCAGWQSALDPHGVQAEALARLIRTVIAVCTVVWLLVTAVLLRAIWRRRPERIFASVDAATERRTRQVVTIAMAATLLVVVALTAVSFLATRRITGDDPHALVVQVRAWQWWWEVTYPDVQPDHRIVTANEIHIPVGRPVRLELAAADVIHSFWVPNLAGKQDMIPGRDNTLSFTARSAGVYRGQCAEFCGLQHAHMAFLIIADEPAEFEAWRARQLAPAVEPTAADAVAGRAVFLARECTSCHTVRGSPATGTLGPDLTHVGSRRTIAAGLFDTTRGSLAAWIADPQTLKPGNNMPMVDLDADELKAVAAYLASLQ
jgi:cytochrome c oxidase subunit 2